MVRAKLSKILQGNSDKSPQINEQFGTEEFYDLLGNKRRLYAISLMDIQNEYNRGRLFDEIAELENNERKNIRSAMHQVHEPQLFKTGVLEHPEVSEIDEVESRENLESGPNLDEFASYVTDNIYQEVRSNL